MMIRWNTYFPHSKLINQSERCIYHLNTLIIIRNIWFASHPKGGASFADHLHLPPAWVVCTPIIPPVTRCVVMRGRGRACLKRRAIATRPIYTHPTSSGAFQCWQGLRGGSALLSSLARPLGRSAARPRASHDAHSVQASLRSRSSIPAPNPTTHHNSTTRAGSNRANPATRSFVRRP